MNGSNLSTKKDNHLIDRETKKCIHVLSRVSLIYRDTDENSHRKTSNFPILMYFVVLSSPIWLSSFQFNSQAENAETQESNMHHIVNFYFMSSCHLRVHNEHRDHDMKFIRTFEKISIKFLPAKDEFLEIFKFSWNTANAFGVVNACREAV